MIRNGKFLNDAQEVQPGQAVEEQQEDSDDKNTPSCDFTLAATSTNTNSLKEASQLGYWETSLLFLEACRTISSLNYWNSRPFKDKKLDCEIKKYRHIVCWQDK